jgi:hypothetical protein
VPNDVLEEILASCGGNLSLAINNVNELFPGDDERTTISQGGRKEKFEVVGARRTREKRQPTEQRNNLQVCCRFPFLEY